MLYLHVQRKMGERRDKRHGDADRGKGGGGKALQQ